MAASWSRRLTGLLAGRGSAVSLDVSPDAVYGSAAATVAAAARAGLSVCDYVERLWHQEGGTQRVIDRMTRAGVLERRGPHIIEIGPGTGRYLEKVIDRTTPGRYEIYETAEDWSRWLAATYPVVAQPADGWSLRATRDASVDLLHAHGVFVALPFLNAIRYFQEAWRVVKVGGAVVFDIYSEATMDPVTIQEWLKSGATYPHVLPRTLVVELFGQHGFELLDAFMNKHGAGRSEYLVFTRRSGGDVSSS